MINKNDILAFLRLNLPLLRSYYHVVRIGVFGSFARDEQRDDSDIDIIVEVEPGTADIHRLKNELREFIGTPFNRSVDIAREKYLKPYARTAILSEVIYVQ